MQGIVHVYDVSTRRSYSVEVNAYWVSIYDGDTPVYVRKAGDDNWLDPSHKAIAVHLKGLEEAVLKVLPGKE